jgi:hypothetical protein
MLRRAFVLLSLLAFAPSSGTSQATPGPVVHRRGEPLPPCPAAEPAREEVRTRESNTNGLRVDACGQVHRVEGGVALGAPAPHPVRVMTATGATIDSMTVSNPYGSYAPTGGFSLLGSAGTYYLSDGSTWSSGAGSYRLTFAELDHIEVTGSTVRYHLTAPTDSVLYEQTDFDFGDQSAQGTLKASGPLVIEATIGSAEAVLRGTALLASNEITWYGEPRFKDTILNNIVDLKEDGTFRLDQSYFDYCTGLRMTNEKFAALFGEKVRKPDELLTQVHMDLAASVQAVTEEIVLRLARSVKKETGAKNICLAGGVALNCVANGKLLRENIFDNIWVQPAAGDAGGAVGAAFAAHHGFHRRPRKPNGGLDGMAGSYLGPSYDEDAAARLLAVGGKVHEPPYDELIERTAQALADQKAVGWMRGRMEFGPRALGARSILGDARSPAMQKTLNLKVKHRESFRPFAPAVLREDVARYFEYDADSPYMLMVAPVREERRCAMTAGEQALFGIDKLNVPRSDIPAVTHVDYSARIQTVHRETNAAYHDLITRFRDKTGCAVVVNTSFNVRGEPIVCTPEDAFRCFMGSEIDVLVVGGCLLLKEEQDPALKIDYKDAFEPD